MNAFSLALILGNENAMKTFQSSLSSYPNGVSYAIFAEIISPLLQKQSAAVGATASEETGKDEESAEMRAEVAFRNAESAAMMNADIKNFSTLEAAGGRRWNRISRLLCREELAGRCSANPVKQMFNRIDASNKQHITWEDVLNYAANEAAGSTSAAKWEQRSYSFSRMRHGLPLQGFGLTRSPWERAGTSLLPEKKKSLAAVVAATDNQSQADKQLLSPTTEGKDDAKKDSNSSNTLTSAHDLSLTRFIAGLHQSKQVFAVSTRLQPFALYSKSTLETVYVASPELLRGSHPTTITYVAAGDVFVSYSSEDRYLRGWMYLLSHSATTVTLEPLYFLSAVRQIFTPSTPSTIVEYPGDIFLGDSQGDVYQIETPRSRSCPMRFTVKRVFSNLHSMETGGIVDLVVADHFLYTTGFDGCLIATHIPTGNSATLGISKDEVFCKLLYIEARHAIVAATSSHRIIMWDARAQMMLPGTVLSYTNHREHLLPIVSLIAVEAFGHVVSADHSGVLKVWDVFLQRCIQTLHGTDAAPGDAAEKDDVVANRAADGAPAPHARGVRQVWPSGLRGGQSLTSIAFLPSTHEIICGYANFLSCYQFNQQRDPLRCDDDVVVGVLYDVRNAMFILYGPTRLSLWDAATGCRRALMDRANDSTLLRASVEILSVCLDDLGSRIFLSNGSGEVEVYETGTLHPVREKVLWLPRPNAKYPIKRMYYSASLRLWLAITVGGTLFVRQVAGNEKVDLSISLPVTTIPLSILNVSEELGLVAVLDEENVLYLYDMKAWSDPPVVKKLLQQVVAITFLGNFPVIVVVYPKGCCGFFSCPPATERLRHLYSLTVSTGVGTVSDLTNSTRPPSAEGHSRGLHWKKASDLTTVGQRRLGNIVDILGFSTKTEITSPLLQNLSSDTEASKNSVSGLGMQRDQPEVTSVAFCTENHRLYFGDALGSVHVFAMCSFLQAFQIPSSTYERRIPFVVPSHLEKPPACLIPRVATSEIHEQVEGSGVASLEWLPSLQMLASSGYDRVVWLLNVDGEKQSFLSMERLPPRETLSGSNGMRGDSTTGTSNSAQRFEGVPTELTHMEYILPSVSSTDLTHFLEKYPLTGFRDASVAYCNHFIAFSSIGDEKIIAASLPTALLHTETVAEVPSCSVARKVTAIGESVLPRTVRSSNTRDSRSRTTQVLLDFMTDVDGSPISNRVTAPSFDRTPKSRAPSIVSQPISGEKVRVSFPNSPKKESSFLHIEEKKTHRVHVSISPPLVGVSPPTLSLSDEMNQAEQRRLDSSNSVSPRLCRPTTPKLYSFDATLLRIKTMPWCAATVSWYPNGGSRSAQPTLLGSAGEAINPLSRQGTAVGGGTLNVSGKGILPDVSPFMPTARQRSTMVPHRRASTSVRSSTVLPPHALRPLRLEHKASVPQYFQGLLLHERRKNLAKLRKSKRKTELPVNMSMIAYSGVEDGQETLHFYEKELLNCLRGSRRTPEE